MSGDGVRILLYGPGEAAKRLELQKLKRPFPSEAIFVFDLKEQTASELKELLVAGSLFVNERLIIVENTPPALDIGELGPWGAETGLVILAGSLPASSDLLKSATKNGFKSLSFEGEKEVSAFPYLDNLIEGRPQAFIELEKLLQEYGASYIFAMIYYLLRRNILPLPTAPFMQQKVKRQKLRFKNEDWPILYKESLAVEFKIKSGLIDEATGLSLLTQRFLGGFSG